MDKHLNLFHSYNQGDADKPEKQKQLEDNLTRALLVTLKNLEVSLQINFIEKLLKNYNLQSTRFEYDLQNTKMHIDIYADKYLIILQRDQSYFDSGEIIRDKQVPDLTEAEKNVLKSEIRKKIKNGKDLEINGAIIPNDELISFQQLFIQGNRPDAWIIGENEVLLFETKIGNNRVSEYQIYRHITGENGFDYNLTNSNEEVNIINVTWADLADIIIELTKKEISELSEFLLNQLLKYITMNGQILNFDYIFEKNINTDIHRQQFNLFLNEFDKALKDAGIKMIRSGRSQENLWETFGYPNNGGGNRDNNGDSDVVVSPEGQKSTPIKNPHYSIYFGEKNIHITLTTNRIIKINPTVINLIQNFFNNKEQNNSRIRLYRYFLDLQSNRLVDPKKGALRGEQQNTLKFFVKFSEALNNFNIILNSVLSLSSRKMYKQFDLGFSVDFYDWTKIREDDSEQIRALNKALLQNPNDLINEFIQFIKETKDIHDALI